MATLAKEIALVTGANSGIGLEVTRQLLAKGYHVYLGARSSSKGTAALEELKSQKLPGTVEFIQLDVQSDDNIDEAAKSLTNSHGKLDVLVNNAGVAISPGATERERLQTAFDVNATGPYLLTKALIPLLRNSTNPRIINITSGAGSIGRRLVSDSVMYKINAVQYRASKAALNMITACQQVEFGLGVVQTDHPKDLKNVEGAEGTNKQMKVFCFCPVFTESNLGEHNKKEFGARSAEDSVKNIMDLVDGKRDSEAGKYIHKDGEYPW